MNPKHCTEPYRFKKGGYDCELSATYGHLWFLKIDMFAKSIVKGPFKSESLAREWLNKNVEKL